MGTGMRMPDGVRMDSAAFNERSSGSIHTSIPVYFQLSFQLAVIPDSISCKIHGTLDPSDLMTIANVTVCSDNEILLVL